MVTASPDRAGLIGVDWGTSNLRVLRIGEGGTVIDARTEPRGAAALTPADFPIVLEEVAADWLDDGLPVVVCGMAGARGKWQEVPYSPTPATIGDLARGLTSPNDRLDVKIVPGLKAMIAGRMVDVMRGEETQVMGLDLEPGSHRVVAVGTHSKWITVRLGQVVSFRTFMTGELFAAVRKGTILGAGMCEPGVDAAAFASGVDYALREPALTAALFSVRVESLADRLNVAGAADYLSGLLIGAEIAVHSHDTHDPVTLVGAEALSARYVTALDIAGFSDVRVADGAEATARGLWRIHKASLT